MDFIESIKYLANQYNIEIQIDESSQYPKDVLTQIFDIHNITATHYLNNL